MCRTWTGTCVRDFVKGSGEQWSCQGKFSVFAAGRSPAPRTRTGPGGLLLVEVKLLCDALGGHHMEAAAGTGQFSSSVVFDL